MHFFSIFVVAVLCAISCMTVMAKNVDTAETITHLQRQYTELEGFAADFEQTLKHKESGTVEKRKGTLLFQKPFLVRWTTGKPHHETLVITDREIWDYLPDEELAYRYPLSMVQDSRNIIQVITGQAALTQDFDVMADGEEENFIRLKLYPREPGPQIVEALIWTDKAGGYIRRAEITDFYGNKNEVRFTSFNSQKSFKANDFSFTPPKGIEVEDHTKKEKQVRQLFK
ncbi:MAG: outer membrane lipoprotein carrier protein LolA [Desulfovibrio sp.]|jgi:outer membrane lipoprotein carrier protein|nr:outer membrane lipoprotein carrier protein LolA [Desulfovibrio sp.]